MAVSHLLGYPRIGPNRELKKACESYWAGKISQKELQEVASSVRILQWRLQRTLGIDLIPSNNFSLYDHVLDTIVLLGAVPNRYSWSGNNVDLDTYFAMARGKQSGKVDVVAMEMTKWFDTNYHYIVPEFTKNQTFKLSSDKPVNIESISWRVAFSLWDRPFIYRPFFSASSLPAGVSGKNGNCSPNLNFLIECSPLVVLSYC